MSILFEPEPTVWDQDRVDTELPFEVLLLSTAISARTTGT